jgi:hypothetical protein
MRKGVVVPIGRSLFFNRLIMPSPYVFKCLNPFSGEVADGKLEIMNHLEAGWEVVTVLGASHPCIILRKVNPQA